MKKRILSVIVFVLLFLLIPTGALRAEESDDNVTILDEGSCGDSLTWVYNSTNIMVISGTGAMNDYEEDSQPWINYREQIVGVEIEDGVTYIGAYAFSSFPNLEYVKFAGDAPEMGISEVGFQNTNSVIYYPADNESWIDFSKINYGGQLEWSTYCLHEYRAEVFEATCETDGYIQYTCDKCGDTYTEPGDAATGHQYDEGVVTEATCTEKGYTTYTCSVCGNSYTDNETEAKGHQYDAGVVTEATCTEKGYTTYTCSVCGDSYTDNEIEAKGHQYGEGVVTEATCTEKGYTTYTCTVCGDSYTDNEVEPTGHLYEYQTNEDGTHSASCSKCGYTENQKCIDEDQDHICDCCNERIILGKGIYGENITWTVYGENILTLEGSGDMADANSSAEVPWSEFADRITSIEMSDEITSIGNYAFYNCSRLNGDLIIPQTIDRIGSYAYFGCAGLDGKLVLPEGLSCIEAFSFSNCGFSDEIIIPDSVETVDNGAFQNCRRIEKLIIGKNLKNMTFTSFQRCTNLKTIEFLCNTPPLIGSNITAETQSSGLVERFFHGLYNLECIYIPEGTYENYADAYGSCLGDYACIREKSDASFLIKNGELIAYFGEESQVSLPDNIVAIGKCAFLNNKTITDVIIPDTVVNIGDSAFKGCTALTSVNIPTMLSVIGNRAFYHCTNLDEISLPESLTTMGSNAFGSSAVKSLYIGNNIPVLSENAFAGTSVTCLQIGKEVTELNQFLTGLSGLKEINVEENNSMYNSVEGVLFDLSAKKLLLYPVEKQDSHFQIPDSVCEIAANAFKGNRYLTSITIPVSLQKIKNNAFSECRSLQKVYFQGPKIDWGLIIIEPGNQWLIGAQLYCDGQDTDGEDMAHWDGSVSAEGLKGKGTSSDPYKISNAKELAYMAEKINSGTGYSGKCFILTNDIVLNCTNDWEQWSSSYAPRNIWSVKIGSTSDHPFEGSFDGNNYSIIGLYTTQGGLFGNCKNCSIKNLRIEQSFIYGGNNVGGIVSSASGGAFSISNCYNYGTVKGGNYVGGLVGSLSYGSVKNCYNAGKVTGNMYVGGIAGKTVSGMESCVNAGCVSGGTDVGGIVGYFGGNSGTIGDCENVGKIYGSSNIGGIAGYAYQGGWSSIYFDNCKNSGAIETSNENAGGIVGYVYADGSYSWVIYIRKCSNIGSVTGITHLGGILGYGFPYFAVININDCYNLAEIKGSTFVGGIYGGGVTKHWTNEGGYENTSIKRTYNLGKVSGNSYVGGITATSIRTDTDKSYYLDESGAASVGGKPLSASQMAQKSSYTGFDFTSVWSWNETAGRPELGPSADNQEPQIMLPVLEEDDAKTFLAFLYNDSSVVKADLSNNRYYHLLTGNYDYFKSDDEIDILITDFSIFAREMMRAQVTDSSQKVDILSDKLCGYLKSKLGGIKETDAEILKSQTGKAQEQLKNGLLDLFCGAVAEHAGIYVTEDTLQNLSLGIKTYNDIVNLPQKAQSYVDDVVAVLNGAVYVLQTEINGRAKYFSIYLKSRPNYSSADDSVFKLIMSSNEFMVSQDGMFSKLLDTVSFITKKDSWQNHVDTLNRWAEFLYLLENTPLRSTPVEEYININDCQISLPYENYTFTGDLIEPEVVLQYNDQVLNINDDYSVSYSNNINTGRANLTITGVGRCWGEKVINFDIIPKRITPVVTLSKDSFIYSGEEKNPSVSVSDGTEELIPDDYDIVYDPGRTDVGSYNVTVKLKGNYSGEGEASFSIEPSEIGLASITGISDKTYTGKPVTQSPVVKYGTAKLSPDEDYSLSYQDNTNVGSAVVTITGKGNFTGSVSKKFSISLAKPAISSVNNVVNGVKIVWGRVTGADKYRIFRKAYNTGTKAWGSWSKVGDTTSVNYIDKTAKSGIKYSYTVRCISTDGKTYTSAYDTAGKTITYVAAPVISSITNMNSGVKIVWPKTAGAAKYRIFRKSGSGSWTKLTDTTSVNYTDTQAANGVTYTYTVRCLNSAGSYVSAYNTTGKSITYVLRPVVSSLTSPKTGQMLVKWGKNDQATGYLIQYSTSSTFASDNKNVIVKGTATVSKTITSLTAKKRYYVRIRTYKTVGGKNYYSAWSAVKNVVTK